MPKLFLDYTEDDHISLTQHTITTQCERNMTFLDKDI